MEPSPKSVPFTHQDRQWDARFNVQTDPDLEALLDGIKTDWDNGRLKYVLVGGVEVGTRPYQDDYQVKHVHVASVFHNRVSKSSILKNWRVKQGNGYYLVPRNRDLPYSGWRNHHIKAFSKVSPERCVLYEMGELPKDEAKQRVRASDEEKKRKIDEVLIDMRGLIEEGKEEEAFRKFPRNYLQYGERIKGMLSQKKKFKERKGDPHIWLFGYAGTGKTSVLSFIYPHYYKKNLYNKFFDLYDDKVHTHVVLEDLDHEAVERLSINFIKTLCDESGFAVDQKYKTPQLTRTTVLVTSNHVIGDLIPCDQLGFEEARAALTRRFFMVNIYNFLKFLGLKLVEKWDQAKLKKEGNTDPSKLFISWDYIREIPTGEPLRTPEEYQEKIRQLCYG